MFAGIAAKSCLMKLAAATLLGYPQPTFEEQE